MAVEGESSEWARSQFREGLSLEQLVALPGTTFTSFAMQIVRQRAAQVPVQRLIGRYLANRFARPTPVPALAIRRVEDVFIDRACGPFELVALAPLVPFGTHSQLTGISQNRMVTALRDAEVAGDPTVGLTLEAAVRRRQQPQSSDPVRLAATQRVTRAQRFTGPDSFAHFTLGALVTAARARSGDRFEADALVAHAAIYVNTLRTLGFDHPTLTISDFAERPTTFCETIAQRVEDDLRTTPSIDTTRTAGRGYYDGLCFKIAVNDGDLEVGDGGTVTWTAQLNQSRPERCFTTGISIERLALHSRG